MEAARFRGITGTGVPEEGFGRYGLFDPRGLRDSAPLLWRVVNPPEGSRLNWVCPAERGSQSPGGQVALVVGWVFAESVDARIAVDRLRYLTPGVVADLGGTLPDGRQFAVALIQSDPPLDEAWDLEQLVDDDRSVRLARRQAFYTNALLARMAPAQGDVPEAWLAGTRLLDLPELSRHLTWRDDSHWPADVGFDVGLQMLLAEVAGVRIPTILAAHQAGRDCLVRQAHDCQHDLVADALAAWQDGIGCDDDRPAPSSGRGGKHG